MAVEVLIRSILHCFKFYENGWFSSPKTATGHIANCCGA